MNLLELYSDYNIPYATEGHKHTRPGWVNTPCPFCVSDSGHEGLHLGYQLSTNRFVCWRCGWHSISESISKILHITEREAYIIIKQYGGIAIRTAPEPIVKIRKKAHRLPSNTMPLQANHRKYLEGRGFDPDELESIWKLLGTGPISKLETLDYRYRIIIPFIWDDHQVSFDTRDITGRAYVKYMACPLDRELIPHKNILYGKQEKWKTTGICVEGPTDVWRFGESSFAVSGIKYTPKQIRIIAQSFKRVPVCFDGGETQAMEQANKLVAELKFRGVDSFRVDITGDPGGMKQSEANYLVKQLLK